MIKIFSKILMMVLLIICIVNSKNVSATINSNKFTNNITSINIIQTIGIILITIIILLLINLNNKKDIDVNEKTN